MPGVWYSPLQTGLDRCLLSSLLFLSFSPPLSKVKEKRSKCLFTTTAIFFLGTQVTVESILHALFVIDPGLKELLAPKSRLQT